MDKVALNRYFEYHKSGRLIRCDVTSQKFKPGAIAGTLSQSGYRVITHYGKKYKEHRLIWKLLKGDIPKGMCIDHINQDRSDNRIENLRVVTRSQNNFNSPVRVDNRSGCKGVYWCRQTKSWAVELRFQNKKEHLGRYKLIDDAIKARREAELRYSELINLPKDKRSIFNG